MKYFTFIFLFFFSFLNANIGKDGFKEFNYNKYFVETGTLEGNAIQQAIKDGFLFIRSIELNKNRVLHAQNKFKNLTNVKIFCGDSSKVLYDVIKDIDEPITFWLDAHIFPPIKNIKNCPLLEELDQIKKHKIKTHTILIDDMICCGTIAFDGITLETLKNKILEINDKYEIKFINGASHYEFKFINRILYVDKSKKRSKDVLIAYVPWNKKFVF